MSAENQKTQTLQKTQEINYIAVPVQKDTIFRNQVVGKTFLGKLGRIAGVVGFGFLAKGYVDLSNQVSSIQPTLDALNSRKVLATSTTQPEPAITPVPLVLTEAQPTTVPPTPSLVPTKETKYPVSSYHVPFEQTPFAKNDKGLARIDMDAYKTYMKKTLASKGEEVGAIVDFDANMLGSETGKGDLTLSHQLNFWITEMKALGWEPEDVNFVFPDLDSFRNALKNGQDVMSKRDGKGRFAMRVEAKDFENAIALASIARYLDGAGKLNGNPDEIKKYLSQSGVSRKIMNLISALIDSTGYSPLAGGDPTKPLKDLSTLLDENANFVSNNGKVCLAVMGKASTRARQKETSTTTIYTQGLEKESQGNDETFANLDSEGEVIVYVTYDMEADAKSSGALSPNGKGIVRVDILAFPNVADQLSQENPKTYVFVDNQGGVWMKTPGSRWIPCGQLQQPQPTREKPGPKFQPTQPERTPEKTSIPPSKQPSVTPAPTQPPQPTRTPGGSGATPIVNTPVPTNAPPVEVNPTVPPTSVPSATPSF